MFNLLRVDFYKLRKSIMFKVCFLISLVCAIALAIVAHEAASGRMKISVSSASGLSDIFIFSILMPFAIGMLVCGDFDNKDIHDEISLGRGTIVISKSIVAFVTALLLTLPYALVGLICFASKGEFSQMFAYSTYLSIMCNSLGVGVSAATVGKAIVKMIVMGLIYASAFSIGIPIAFKVRKPILAIIIGEVIAFSNAFVVELLHSIPGIGKVIELTPYYYTNMPADITNGNLVKYSIYSIVFFALMIGSSYLIFRKADIK